METIIKWGLRGFLLLVYILLHPRVPATKWGCKQLGLIVTSHEISHVTETHDSPSTHVWSPRGALSGTGWIRCDPPRR
jgi:hypothetical protein